MALVANLDVANTGSWPGPGSHSVTMATYQRSSPTTTYAVGDVVSAGGAAKALVFPECGPSGALLNAQLVVEENDQQDFELLVFNEEPTNFTDNSPLALVSGDAPKLVAVYGFDGADSLFLTLVGPGFKHYPSRRDQATATPNAYVTADGKNLYGLLVVRTGWIPVASVKVHIRLGLQGD